ncbi:rod shape-determining protein MreD [Nocardioides sp. Root1257]|uniref:rod shape-determining protein MreD n=1 Tax=unclassified Nocardioides TaxID=2615069 RepID=UPI0006F702C6|nr:MULTISPECIES: rod shape-determining protein MreD [unclassified Nocardioides]KQW48428.1 rod shape-determining protein MreD [Nocardioides sp. Root1257]KRC47602.1 rod shape-determining protein MreD [Nocardioides sp. Root224]
MTALRALVAAAAVGVALILQVSFFPHLSWDGIVPNVCLLVVVGAALVRGPEFAAVLGFIAGLALDLAPPADHLAGRWALALVVVGYVAGRVRRDARSSGTLTAGTVVATVAASSFVGTSVFALSGLVLGDPIAIPELLEVVLVGVLWDVVLTPLVLPPVMAMFRQLEPDRSLT